MEEDQYRSAYRQINQLKCAFEKAILANRCTCPLSHKFYLAEREGISCRQTENQQRCQALLQKSREKSLFVFKLTRFSGALPHAKEIRVQLGSLTGLAELLGWPKTEKIHDINRLLAVTEERYQGLDELPYKRLIQAVNQTQSRRRKK